MNTPTVSIITPAYNAAPFIGETIASVKAQSFAGWEMVIVDDGSDDNTADAARLAAEGDPRIIVVEAPHSGLPSVGRNRALAHARGAYIAFLDADDLWMPDKLSIQTKQLDGRVAWGFSNSYFFSGGADSPDGRKYPANWRPARPFFPQLFTTEGVPFLTLIAHRQLLERVAPKNRLNLLFNESKGFKAVEDWDLMLRLARISEPLYIQKPLAKYRAHGGGISKAWEKNFRRTTRLIRHYAHQGTSPALCQKAYNLQLSKRATNRMLGAGGPWRGDLLQACFPPLNLRDLYIGSMAFLPLPLARAMYRRGLAAKRRG